MAAALRAQGPACRPWGSPARLWLRPGPGLSLSGAQKLLRGTSSRTCLQAEGGRGGLSLKETRSVGLKACGPVASQPRVLPRPGLFCAPLAPLSSPPSFWSTRVAGSASCGLDCVPSLPAAGAPAVGTSAQLCCSPPPAMAPPRASPAPRTVGTQAAPGP